MNDFRRSSRLFILLLIPLFLGMGCNSSPKISNGTPEPEESRFATSESGLSNDEIPPTDNLTNDEIDATMNAPISPFHPDERKFPPGFGDTRVEYNHLVKFEQTIGEIGLKTEIEVIDYVPISYTAIGLAPRRCGGETMDWPFFKLQGENETQYWFGYYNLYVLTRYNRNLRYGLVVDQLGSEIRKAGFVGDALV